MKQLILIAIGCLLGASASYGQCVIYADDNTGAFGAGYNNDNKPTTYKECTDLAIKECKSKGGNNCTFFYKSAKTGWWGVISGKKQDGRNYFQGGDGYSSQSEAERAVRKKYRDDGGADADNVKVVTWYTYSNVKL